MDKRHRIPLCSCVVDWPYFSTMEVHSSYSLNSSWVYYVSKLWALGTTTYLNSDLTFMDWPDLIRLVPHCQQLIIKCKAGQKATAVPTWMPFSTCNKCFCRKPTTKLISSQRANQEKIHLLALCLLPPFWSLFVLLRLHTLIDMVLLIFGPSFQRSLPRSNEIQMPRGKRCQRWYFVFQIIFGGIFTEKTKLHLHEDPLGDELSHSVKILCEYAYDT